MAKIMLSTNHSLVLEAAVVSEDERYYLMLAQNSLSDHPICAQLPAASYFIEYNVVHVYDYTTKINKFLN